MINLYFLDFETTGLNQYHDEVIEIGIKKFDEENEYTTLVVPENENGIHYKYVSKKITEVTGITDKDIIDHGISPEEATFGMYKYIVDTCGEGPIYLIAHNGLSFDFIFFKRLIHKYITAEKQRTRSTSIDLDIINRIRYHDTLLMARYLIPNDRVSQPILCKRFNVKNEKEHRAMGDVDSLIKLYKILCEQLSYMNKKGNKDFYINNIDVLMQELMI
jgi:DNA polymerase III alpha subunit (gram-positive type)